MNVEFKMCVGCMRYRQQQKLDICATELQPEVYDRGDKVIPIEDKKFKQFINCRHITCRLQGMEAANWAWQRGVFEKYTLANGESVLAVTFGTLQKPTDDGKRIVSIDGKIYSLQAGKYYFTGISIPRFRMTN